VPQFLTAQIRLAVGLSAVIVAVCSFGAENFAGKDLAKKDFANGSLNNANFEGANLEFANFSNATLKGANFRNARLAHANFRLANLEGADFTGADLKGVTWTDAKAWKAELAGTDIYLARASVIDTKGLNLDYKAEQLIMQSQDASSGRLAFHYADLQNSKIMGNADGVDFRDADLRGADLSQAENVDKARLKNAKYDENTRWNIDPAKMQAVLVPEKPSPGSGKAGGQSSLTGKWLILKEKGATENGSLRIKSDGTYEWDYSSAKPVLKGKWNESGSAVVLKTGELGQDWTATIGAKDDLHLKSANGDERLAVKSD
jgi:uncharacterized protein YjbI with pentapeptide repeats